MAFLGSYLVAGQVYSILCLTLVVVFQIMFRVSFRSLDFLQMSFFFASLMSPTSFSSSLGSSVVNFSSNFLTFCSTGDIICTLGFQLSLAIVMVGVLLLVLILVFFQKCSKPHIRFEPFYSFIKGFFRWVYLPLVVYTTQSTIKDNNGATYTTSLMVAEIILAVSVLFPIFQVVIYSCIEENEQFYWHKWHEFLSYLRLLSVGVLLGVALAYNNTFYCQFITIPIVLYDFIVLWKGEFKYPILQKVVFFLGELIFLVVFLFFKYNSNYLLSIDLDFFLLGAIIFIDVLLYIFRGARLAMYGSSEQVKVVIVPEGIVGAQYSSMKIGNSKRILKYEHDSRQQLQHVRP